MNDRATVRQRPAAPNRPGTGPALPSKAAKARAAAAAKRRQVLTVAGAGAAAQAGQTITVNYVGVTLADGKEFDSSWNRSQPLSFALGGGNVIQGWDQGLVGVKVGSRVQLDIPAALAYGDNPRSGAPRGALRFIVDVLSVA
ncbi:FKBP-type peptidyl-prolyl cis-trans isomerase [Dactylosporangium sp. NPDC048998]|uniref:FKBP-type peptidyl-prolyl cis-trans isomerase n=1 Tax=Dactylosporangium sp. NPDC048998 TaxID=3363976 RepID=UPI0037113BB7